MEGMSRQAPGSDGNVGAEQTRGRQSIAPDVETEPDTRTKTPHPHRQADLEEHKNDGMNEGESIFVCLDDTHAGQVKSVGPRCASDTPQSNMKTNRTPAVPRASRHAADGFGLTINELRCYKSAAPPYGAQARVEWRHIFRGQTLVVITASIPVKGKISSRLVEWLQVCCGYKLHFLYQVAVTFFLQVTHLIVNILV